jgi:hypothetical protein
MDSSNLGASRLLSKSPSCDLGWPMSLLAPTGTSRLGVEVFGGVLVIQLPLPVSGDSASMRVGMSRMHVDLGLDDTLLLRVYDSMRTIRSVAHLLPRHTLYLEEIERGPAVPCRLEQFTSLLPCAGLEDLLDATRAVAQGVIGARATLLKDKINLKWPGGAGYRAHQDAVAYFEWSAVVTVAVALTKNTVQNGCLWVSADPLSVLPTAPDGTVDAKVAQALDFEPVELVVGEGVVLTGTRPHLSKSNLSQSVRGLALLTYTASEASEAPRREYYRRRDEHLSMTEQPQLSTISDFEGRVTTAEP